jgi:hypothetical protein
VKTYFEIGLVLVGLALANPAVAQFDFITNADNTITITGYIGSGGDVTIPSTINGLTVTAIGDSAFDGLTNVTSVTIPDSVVSLGDWAFAGCALSSVTLGSGITNIPSYAFYGSGLISVAVPNSVISIDNDAFLACGSLTNVTIPNSVTRIMEAAFLQCFNLQGVIFPSSVSYIGDSAFLDCEYATGFYFTGNAPIVEGSAFEYCDLAKVYYLPGTSGWTNPIVGYLPTAPWALPYPLILTGSPGFGVLSNGFGFPISWVTNASVVVEACTNLAAPVWTPVSTNTLILSSGVSYFTDSQWTNHPVRFYRLKY